MGARGARGDRYKSRPRQEYDQSPWISTTGNLDWAIWYIAKLLSRGTAKVHLSIINNNRRTWFTGELRVAPFLNRSKAEWIDLPMVDKQRYLRASAGAGRAREVLFYGRIFGDSLLADLTFTHHVSRPRCGRFQLGEVAYEGWGIGDPIRTSCMFLECRYPIRTGGPTWQELAG